jgi:hypothetical protein
MVLSGAISLRATSRILSLILPHFNLESSSVPSWHTGRLWLIRLGYYKLYRSKVKANDWVWIVDHSIQAGSEKCFMILGIRLSELPKGRPLTYEDVEPIALLPVVKSNGAVVYEQLESIVEKTGVPRSIVGDYGSDIKAGIEKFCLKYQGTAYIYDMKHKMASLLKKMLHGNERWELMKRLSKKTKQQIHQTPLAALAPPAQRTKARYMNTEFLLNWATKILLFIEQSDEKLIQLGYEAAKVQEKLGWLTGFQQDIECWTQIVNMVTITEHFIRNQGLYRNCNVQLNEIFAKEIGSIQIESVRQFQQDILHFVKNESQKALPEERLLGSSEIIESVFGKQKFIEKEQSASGFTGLLLTLGSIVSKTTIDVVKQAMEATPTKIIHEWYRTHIKKSSQAKRIEAFNLIETMT